MIDPIKQTRAINLLANRLQQDYGGIDAATELATKYVTGKPGSPGLHQLLESGTLKGINQDKDFHTLAAPYLDRSASQRNAYRHGPIGALKEGFLRAYDSTGYLDPRVDPKILEDVPSFYVKNSRPDANGVPRTTSTEFAPMSGQLRSQYAKEFFNISAQAAGYTPVENAMFKAGTVLGDIAGNGIRHWYWNLYPADIVNKRGTNAAMGAPTEGFPKPETYMYQTASGEIEKTKPLPGSREAAAMGAVGGMLGVEALFAGSGNYNPMNLAEGGRGTGYSALSAEEGGDQRKPTSVIGDIFQRHVLGRKGRILPWEQFKLERPDVSYENYERYRNWQYGRSGDDPVNDATFGVAKFTPHGLDGQTPELNIMGVSITPLGAAAAAGAVLGTRQAHKYLARRAFDEYADLLKVASERPWTPEEALKMSGDNAYNPFAKHANRSDIRRAQYQHDIDNYTGRYAHHANPNAHI